MRTIILATLLVTVFGGHIQHSDKATSYQNFEIEHHHAVPTYVKGEDAQFLHHPVSKGRTASKVEVHHGDKHDHGYAITDVESNQGHATGYDLGGEHSQVQYVQDQSPQYYQYQPEENQKHEQPQYQTINANQYQHFADAAVGKLAQQQGFGGYQGVGQYEAYPQRHH
ncbi:uncharacterized protein LOC109598603 [Aethina tumida]|uniref:uncharacterized protein LOC109598603 n=1 Tax=Aethina tumida TaxID=116153 RepID=UPI00096B0253|nr:uncharacterized protein LOC109598603 [Aethina tumida]